MNAWLVTWWDGCSLRLTEVSPCDAWNVVSVASSAGVYNTSSIIKIERIAQ